MFIVLMLVIMMVLIEHPIMMVIGLISYTFFIAFVSFINFGTFWYGGLILLVMLSGVLVIFIYMASLSPNDGVFLDYLGLLFVGICVIYSFNWVGGEDHSVLAVKLLGNIDGVINLYLLIILLVALLVVVCMCSVFKGPIRI